MSLHFSLTELTRTDYPVDNTPGPVERANLERLAEFLEEVRTLLGVPITVNSAYRGPEVNRLAHGSETSAHMRGEAGDIVPIRMPIVEAYHIIHDAPLFQRIDQLIYENKKARGGFVAWIHLGLSPNPRRQALAWSPATNGRYVPYSDAYVV